MYPQVESGLNRTTPEPNLPGATSKLRRHENKSLTDKRIPNAIIIVKPKALENMGQVEFYSNYLTPYIKLIECEMKREVNKV